MADHPGRLRSFLELFALSGLAVAQPVLEVFGRAPDVFIFHGSLASDIVWFGVLVVVVPPAVLWAIEQGIGFASQRAGRVVHVVLLGTLAGLTVLQVAKRSELGAGLLLATAGVVAAFGAAYLYVRVRPVALWLAYMALAPLAFFGAFLWTSPVSDLVFAPEVEAAEVDEAREPRSVVLIVWDELPLESIVNGDGAIDAELYPNIAGLASDGVWYRNATTVATITSAAVPSILTGQFPEDGQAPVAADHPENLFTLLASQYDLDVVEQVTALCPSALCSDQLVDDPAPNADQEAEDAEPERERLGGVLADARDAYEEMVSLDDADEGPQAFTDQTTTATTAPPEADAEEAIAAAEGDEAEMGGAPVLQIDSFESLLASIEPGEDPTLHFLHLQLPHAPYRFLPNGQTYQDANADGGVVASIEDRGPEQYETDADRQRLLMQVGYVDTLIGQLTDRLRETGLDDEAVVVMTSDHGVGLEPGQPKRPLLGDAPVSESIYADLLYVPLIVRAPGLEPGAVSDRNAMTIDIVPTIADLLGVGLPWDTDGVSLLAGPRASPDKRFHRVLFGSQMTLGGMGDARIGPVVTFDGQEFLDQMLDRDIDTLLGDNPEHRLFDIADGGELIGMSVDDLETGRRSRMTARLDGVDALRNHDESAEFVPARVRGPLEGAGRDDVTVAVAVDGVIAGVAPSYPDGDESHYLDVMVDPALVPPGRHDVELYAVQGREGERVLRPVG